jgi:hypothetical protein
MILRAGFFISATLLVLLPTAAHATLVGTGKTVQAFYYNGQLASPEGEEPVGASTDDPASLATAVNYQLGAADFSTISVGNLQIVITNMDGGAPFCLLNTPGSACVDAIDGFDFKFTGENITGVTTDAGTSAGFLPVSATFQGNTHLGLQLISPDEIRVDVTGDETITNGELILDVSTAELVPEPSTLLLAGPLVLGLVIRNAFRRAGVAPR